MSRLTRKQRLKLKREREAAHKAFMRRGDIRRAEERARDARSAERVAERVESPRERHLREQREREQARIEARRAEHRLADGKVWAMADAAVGRMGDLCEKLRQAEIPHFRPQDEVEQVLASGRVRKLKVPLVARTVFVGIETREHLAKLQALFPWLNERVPGQRYGHPAETLHDVGGQSRFDRVQVGDRVEAMPGEAFPWHVDRYERTQSQDPAGESVRVPAVVPDVEMRRFAERLIEAAPVVDLLNPFAIGEGVRVADGPFASFSGVVEEIDTARCTLKVAVSIFGRATPVVLEFKQIERL